MVWSENHPHLKECFDSDESFLALMKRVARSNVSKAREQPITEEISHPDQDTLGDYVDGVLSNEETVKVMEHLAECRLCARRSLRMSWAIDDMTDDLLAWSNRDESDSKAP